MTEERAKRKLSAVLSADVKGYSRLMGQDEAGTVNRSGRSRYCQQTQRIPCFDDRSHSTVSGTSG